MTKKTHLINILTASAVFLLLLLLNSFCIYHSDDYHFKFVWESLYVGDAAALTPITSLKTLIGSLKDYYTLSGGRLIPHFLAFSLLCADKMVFNILNSLVFVALGVIIYKMYLSKNANSSPLALACIYLSLLLLLHSFGDNVLWLSGSANYLWSGTLLLFSVYCLEKYEYTAIKAVPISILILLSSSTNEVTGGMLLIVLFVFWLRNKRKMPIFYILSAVIGMATVILAPGNFNRPQIAEYTPQLTDIGAKVSALARYLHLFVCDGFLVLTLFMIVYIILRIYFHHSIFDIIYSLRFSIAGAAGIIALSVPGGFYERAAFLGEILIITNACRIFPDIIDMIKKFKYDRSQMLRSLKALSFSWLFLLLLSMLALGHILTAASAIVKCIIFGSALVATEYYRSCLKNHKPLNISINNAAIQRIKRMTKAIPAVTLALAIAVTGYNTVLYISSSMNYLDVFAGRYVDWQTKGAAFTRLPKASYGIFFPTEAAANSINSFGLEWYNEVKNHGLYYPFQNEIEQRCAAIINETENT